MIKTPEQYVQSLRDGRVVYQDGELIKDVPTRYKDAVERSASEFWISNQPEHRSLFNMVEDGEEVSFSFKVPKTGEDLQRRREIVQTLTRNRIGGSRLTGIDSLNGVAYACDKIDAAMGTHYAENMRAYRAWCKKNDPGLCAAVSDPKGNRRLHAEDPNQHKHRGNSHHQFDPHLRQKRLIEETQENPHSQGDGHPTSLQFLPPERGAMSPDKDHHGGAN